MAGINQKQYPGFIDIKYYSEMGKVVLKQLELMEQTQQEILIELRKMNSDKLSAIKEPQQKRTTKRK